MCAVSVLLKFYLSTVTRGDGAILQASVDLIDLGLDFSWNLGIKVVVGCQTSAAIEVASWELTFFGQL